MRLWIATASLLAAALVVITRVVFLSRWPANFDADEALIALHAQRLLDGRLSLFLPGQSYMGSLQSALAGLLTTIFGEHATVARLAPIAWIVPGWWVLERLDRSGTRPISVGRGRLLLALQWFLPPGVLFFLGVKIRGGFVESLVLAMLALFLLWPRADAVRLRDRMIRWGSGGCILGIGLWTHDQTLLVIPAVVAAAFLQTRSRTASSVALLAALFVGFVAGYLPLWLPRVAPAILDAPALGSVFEAVKIENPLSLRSMRILLSAFHQSLIAGGSPHGVSAAGAWLHTGLTLLAVVFAVRWFIRRPVQSVRERPLLVAALYLAAANLGALILLPAYAEDPGWYRYTLFLAPLLVYARAAAIDRLPSALGWAGAIGFALLSAHGYSIAVPGWAHSHDDLRPALVRHLEQRSIRHVLTNWTLAAPIQFFSNGRIVCQEDAHERLPESSTEVLLASDAWTVAARPPVAVRTQAESSIESAFEIRPRPPRPGATLFPAYEELDLDRTLFAHLEPWPLLPPGSWKRDWRGWPYRRPLGRFDAIIWLPNRFADLEQRAHAQAAIERLQERGEFATVAHAGEPQILRRSNVSALNR